MNDHDPENLRAADRKMRTSQATIAMPNGSHQQLGQHTRCNILPQAVAFVCAKPSVDTGACLIDAGFVSSSKFQLPHCPLGVSRSEFYFLPFPLSAPNCNSCLLRTGFSRAGLALEASQARVFSGKN